MSCGSSSRISQGGGLPLDNAMDAIHPAQGVDIAHKIAGAGTQRTVEPDLEVPSSFLD